MNAKEILNSWESEYPDMDEKHFEYSEREVLEIIYHTINVCKSKPKGKTLEERKDKFNNELSRYAILWSHDLLEEFQEYWTEHGENDKKMRFEKEKSFGIKRRLATWKKNSKKWDSNKPVSLADKMKKQFGV